ncbi:ABC transporter permease [Salmonirosea aquatica]|uniref:FtsX-like permease family protein n=1 Tax=Salmonirosea aquatica TaxID=2654236 RepID=A0A7C9BBD7_9BACT|nr:FtsX-like permease family protein [Cytophagaceae bacterium SJW1-29]
MLSSYVKIALRIFKKDKTFSAINLVGLATGLAVALLIIQYVRFELSYENTHPLADRIVRLTMDFMNGNTVDAQDTETNPPVGPKAMREMPEVVNYTRAYPFGEPNITIQIGENFYLVEKVFAVDSSFFSMFNYPLIRGNRKGIMTKTRQVVLTESMATKYFNTLDVLGKTVKIPKPDGGALVLEVVGVVPDSPANTHLKFDMLFSYPTMLSDMGETEDNWNGNNTLTYLELAENADYDAFTKSLVAFNERMIKDEIIKNRRVIGQKISDIHLYSHKNFETEPNGDAKSVFFLLGVAFLVLISAFVNYVNLTTSKALDRAREIGMRKVVGSTQTQIRTQIFTETVLMNLAAGLLAVALIGLVRPLFLEVAGLPEDFPVFGDLFFWQSLGAFLLLSIVVSGLYPAFVLSSFEPVRVLKGTFSRSTQGVVLRKALVVFQFTITIVLLVQTFTVYRQVHFLRDQNLGVNVERTLVVKAPVGNTAQKEYGTFRQALLAQSQVEAVSLSGTVPGLGITQLSTTTSINLSDAAEKNSYNFYLTNIDSSFVDLMGIKLLAGKNYDATSWPVFSDTTKRDEVLVNEEALRLWGIPTPQEAVGRELSFWGRQWTIRGVLKNYHYESPKAAYIPMIHFYSPNFDSFASVKFSGGNASEQLATLKKVYKSNFPYSPFSYFFLDSEYDKQYKADDRFQQVFSALTGFAILISCLGLFGLATFTVSKRTKEIGIRKVIGASTTNLMILLSKDFMKTVLMAVVIGIPITYFLVENWLANYASHIALSWWLFAAPAALVFVLVIVSISGKTIATALMNPVKSLRSE